MTATRQLTLGFGGSVLPPAREGVREIGWAEAAGFWGAWWPDHLMGWFPQAAWEPAMAGMARHLSSPHALHDPFSLAGAAAAETRTIRLGISVTDPFRRSPALLAQVSATLNELSGGRFVLGIGSGIAENLIPFGIPHDSPVGHLEEALEVMRLLWSTEEPVSLDGRFWSIRSAVSGLPQAEDIPRVWVAAHGRRALEIAGRLGDGWIPTRMAPEAYAEHLGAVERALLAAGRKQDDFVASMFAWLVLGESHEASHQLIDGSIVKSIALFRSPEFYESIGFEHPLGTAARGYGSYVPSELDFDGARAALERIPFEAAHEYFLHGTPDDVTEALRDYAAAGCDHVILYEISLVAAPDSTASRRELLEQLVHQIQGSPVEHGNRDG